MIFTVSRTFSFSKTDKDDMELYSKMVLPSKTDIEKNGWIIKERDSVITLSNISFSVSDPKKLMDQKVSDISVKEELNNEEKKTDE